MNFTLLYLAMWLIPLLGTLALFNTASRTRTMLITQCLSGLVFCLMAVWAFTDGTRFETQLFPEA